MSEVEEKPISFCADVAKVSSDFENCNTEIKRKYLISNINLINSIMESVPGFKGSFGTGYPFYVLDENLHGDLPIIKEQMRYNNELISFSIMSDKDNWTCASCLATNSSKMLNLKHLCKPCPKMDDELKPRKVLNRLPDIDMWLICKDEYVEEAKRLLPLLFEKYDMHTSDVDPIQAINSVASIVNDLKQDKIPNQWLPLDIHIIEYSKIHSLIEEVPIVLQQYLESNGEIAPYLPIHPHSLRKTWQYDDTAYNFVFDYLYSLTDFNWESELHQELTDSRKIVVEAFNHEQLKEIFDAIAPASAQRRMENKQLQKRYEERTRKWES